jgi:hypothetical protein
MGHVLQYDWCGHDTDDFRQNFGRKFDGETYLSILLIKRRYLSSFVPHKIICNLVQFHDLIFHFSYVSKLTIDSL